MDCGGFCGGAGVRRGDCGLFWSMLEVGAGPKSCSWMLSSVSSPSPSCVRLGIVDWLRQQMSARNARNALTPSMCVLAAKS